MLKSLPVQHTPPAMQPITVLNKLCPANPRDSIVIAGGIAVASPATAEAPQYLNTYNWINLVKLDPHLTTLWIKITNLQKLYHTYKMNQLARPKVPGARLRCSVVECDLSFMNDDGRTPSPMSRTTSKMTTDVGISVAACVHSLWESAIFCTGPKFTTKQIQFLVDYFYASADHSELYNLAAYYRAEVVGFVRRTETMRLGAELESVGGLFNTPNERAVLVCLTVLIMDELLAELSASKEGDYATRFQRTFPGLHVDHNAIHNEVYDTLERIYRTEPNAALSHVPYITAGLFLFNRQLSTGSTRTVKSLKQVLEAVLGGDLRLWTSPESIRSETEASAEAAPNSRETEEGSIDGHEAPMGGQAESIGIGRTDSLSGSLEPSESLCIGSDLDEERTVDDLRMHIATLWHELVRVVNVVTVGLVTVKHPEEVDGLVLRVFARVDRATNHHLVMFLNAGSPLSVLLHIHYLIARMLMVVRHGIWVTGAPKVHVFLMEDMMMQVLAWLADRDIAQMGTVRHTEAEAMMRFLKVFMMYVVLLQAEEAVDKEMVRVVCPAIFVEVHRFVEFLLLRLVDGTSYTIHAVTELLNRTMQIVIALILRARAYLNSWSERGILGEEIHKNKAAIDMKLKKELGCDIDEFVGLRLINAVEAVVGLLTRTPGPRADRAIKLSKVWKFYLTFISNSRMSYAKIHESVLGMPELKRCPLGHKVDEKLEKMGCPVKSLGEEKIIPKTEDEKSIMGCPVDHKSMGRPVDQKNGDMVCPVDHKSFGKMGGCPVDHKSFGKMGGCPVDHKTMGQMGCPVDHKAMGAGGKCPIADVSTMDGFRRFAPAVLTPRKRKCPFDTLRRELPRGKGIESNVRGKWARSSPLLRSASPVTTASPTPFAAPTTTPSATTTAAPTPALMNVPIAPASTTMSIAGSGMSVGTSGMGTSMGTSGMSIGSLASAETPLNDELDDLLDLELDLDFLGNEVFDQMWAGTDVG